MGIQELYKAGDNNPATLQKIFKYLHDKSTPISYTTVAPTADKVPFGGIVIHDDGTNRRIYLNTGQGKVGYINFSATI